MFEVRDVGNTREGWFGEWEGAVRPRLDWETEYQGPVTAGAEVGR